MIVKQSFWYSSTLNLYNRCYYCLSFMVTMKVAWIPPVSEPLLLKLLLLCKMGYWYKLVGNDDGKHSLRVKTGIAFLFWSIHSWKFGEGRSLGAPGKETVYFYRSKVRFELTSREPLDALDVTRSKNWIWKEKFSLSLFIGYREKGML